MIDFTKLGSLYRPVATGARPADQAGIPLNTMQARDPFQMVNAKIKTAESLKVKILKGTKRGESAEVLLLEAVKCISLLTSDDVFCEQIAEDVKLRHQIDNGNLTCISMEKQHRLHLMKRCIEEALQQYNERKQSGSECL